MPMMPMAVGMVRSLMCESQVVCHADSGGNMAMGAGMGFLGGMMVGEMLSGVAGLRRCEWNTRTVSSWRLYHESLRA